MASSLKWNTVLCRYGEIALKGNNRRFFENRLLENIRRSLQDDQFKFMHDRGRLLISKAKRADFSDQEMAFLKEKLSKIFGLTSFSFGRMLPAELEAIEAFVDELIPHMLGAFAGEDEVTYSMRLLKEYPRLKLNLDQAEISLSLEIRKRFAVLFCERYEAASGLPSGSSSSALALLSGGIDSPVASYQMMSRGCRLDFITFHSYPYTPPELLPKVAEIASQLNSWQLPGRLYACNLVEAQKVIRDSCDPSYRTVFYRRLMFRVAEKLAEKLKHEALVTGESVGQVASQTIRNLDAINRATRMLVLRPLLGMDKHYAINLAEKIGTLEQSNIQCADSCTVVMPDSPIINPLYLIESEESILDMDALVAMSLKSIHKVSLPDGELLEPTFSE